MSQLDIDDIDFDHCTILLGLGENFQENKIRPFFSSKRDQLLPVHYRSLKSHLPPTYQWYEWCGKKNRQGSNWNHGALYWRFLDTWVQHKELTSCPFFNFLQQCVQQYTEIYLYIYDIAEDKRKMRTDKPKKISLKELIIHRNEESFFIRPYVLYHLIA